MSETSKQSLELDERIETLRARLKANLEYGHRLEEELLKLLRLRPKTSNQESRDDG
jgi:hypothetical protein